MKLIRFDNITFMDIVLFADIMGLFVLFGYLIMSGAEWTPFIVAFTILYGIILFKSRDVD